MRVDPFNPDSFSWILKEIDVPYIEDKWEQVRNKEYAKNPKKLGATLGKYLSQMKLGQWKNYHYADSDRLNANGQAARKALLKENPDLALKEQQIQDQYNQGLISEAEYRTRTSAEFQHQTDQERMILEAIAADGGPMPEAISPAAQEEFLGPGANLDIEDKIYLATKWGTMYQPNELVSLEKTYNDMMSSFDIQDADSIISLKNFCKANLKADQAIDINDFDGFQKLMKVTEGLRKAAKWTAQQNNERAAGLSCVGNIVAYCEKQGGRIPQMDLKIPRDDIDIIIKDSKEYIKSLFYSDPSLAQQVEQYLQKKEILDEKKREKELEIAAGNLTEEDLEKDIEITDQDIYDYEQSLAEMAQHDKDIISEELKENNRGDAEDEA